MTSIWEELEKLTKDELIIELVRWRNLYGLIREDQPADCVYLPMEPLHTGEGGAYLGGRPPPYPGRRESPCTAPHIRRTGCSTPAI